jgi:hypothetical protein
MRSQVNRARTADRGRSPGWCARGRHRAHAGIHIGPIDTSYLIDLDKRRGRARIRPIAGSLVSDREAQPPARNPDREPGSCIEPDVPCVFGDRRRIREGSGS